LPLGAETSLHISVYSSSEYMLIIAVPYKK
jgi:hypothetical protein